MVIEITDIVARYKERRDARIAARKDEKQRTIDAYKERRDARRKARLDADEPSGWITINGAAVPLDENGEAYGSVVDKINSENGKTTSQNPTTKFPKMLPQKDVGDFAESPLFPFDAYKEIYRIMEKETGLDSGTGIAEKYNLCGKEARYKISEIVNKNRRPEDGRLFAQGTSDPEVYKKYRSSKWVGATDRYGRASHNGKTILP